MTSFLHRLREAHARPPDNITNENNYDMQNYLLDFGLVLETPSVSSHTRLYIFSTQCHPLYYDPPGAANTIAIFERANSLAVTPDLQRRYYPIISSSHITVQRGPRPIQQPPHYTFPKATLNEDEQPRKENRTKPGKEQCDDYVNLLEDACKEKLEKIIAAEVSTIFRRKRFKPNQTRATVLEEARHNLTEKFSTVTRLPMETVEIATKLARAKYSMDDSYQPSHFSVDLPKECIKTTMWSSVFTKEFPSAWDHEITRQDQQTELAPQASGDPGRSRSNASHPATSLASPALKRKKIQSPEGRPVNEGGSASQPTNQPDKQDDILRGLRSDAEVVSDPSSCHSGPVGHISVDIAGQDVDPKKSHLCIIQTLKQVAHPAFDNKEYTQLEDLAVEAGNAITDNLQELVACNHKMLLVIASGRLYSKQFRRKLMLAAPELQDRYVDLELDLDTTSFYAVSSESSFVCSSLSDLGHEDFTLANKPDHSTRGNVNTDTSAASHEEDSAGLPSFDFGFLLPRDHWTRKKPIDTKVPVAPLPFGLSEHLNVMEDSRGRNKDDIWTLFSKWHQEYMFSRLIGRQRDTKCRKDDSMEHDEPRAIWRTGLGVIRDLSATDEIKQAREGLSLTMNEKLLEYATATGNLWTGPIYNKLRDHLLDVLLRIWLGPKTAVQEEHDQDEDDVVGVYKDKAELQQDASTDSSEQVDAGVGPVLSVDAGAHVDAETNEEEAGRIWTSRNVKDAMRKLTDELEHLLRESSSSPCNSSRANHMSVDHHSQRTSSVLQRLHHLSQVQGPDPVPNKACLEVQISCLPTQDEDKNKSKAKSKGDAPCFSNAKQRRALKAVINVLLESPCIKSKVLPKYVQDSAFDGHIFTDHELSIAAHIINGLRPFVPKRRASLDGTPGTRPHLPHIANRAAFVVLANTMLCRLG
ncbi:hypothetical protein BGZ74_003834, partial [Mortierella antarctica]